MNDPETWRFRLYVAGQSPRSVTALKNLKSLCDSELAGRYEIEVIDLTLDPAKAKADGILVIPTLVKIQPDPTRRVIGDLSQSEKVRFSLELPENP